jgi:hypothetical protein
MVFYLQELLAILLCLLQSIALPVHVQVLPVYGHKRIASTNTMNDMEADHFTLSVML